MSLDIAQFDSERFDGWREDTVGNGINKTGKAV
jgi:hypothetical protein